MKKTMIEQQPKEIAEAQDFIMAQNPDIRVLLERDIKGIDQMTYPRFFQEIKTGILFLQTLVQDSITRCIEDLKESETLWTDAEEIASEELKARDPYRALSLKYKEAINALFNSFAARNIENQFLSDLGERSNDIISNFRSNELQEAQFNSFKEFYEQSMSSRDSERKEFREFAENLFEKAQQTVRQALPYMSENVQQPMQNRQPMQPTQPMKKISQPNRENPTNHKSIRIPANLSKRSERLKYLLKNYPEITQEDAMNMTGVGRGTLSRVKKEIKDEDDEQKPQEEVQEMQEIPEGEMEEEQENANDEDFAEDSNSDVGDAER